MRVLVTGDREWADKALVYVVLTGYYELKDEPFTLIEGGARGADHFAGMWAATMGDEVEHLHYPANWNRDGKAAGPMRNQRMLTDGNPDLVLAFHDSLLNSKGTKHMIRIARRANVPVVHVRHVK